MSKSKLAVYRKAIVAALGVFFVLASSFGLGLGADVEPAVVAAVNAGFGLATVLAVHQVPNAAPAPPVVVPPPAVPAPPVPPTPPPA